ncbi:hypothetical protein GCM10009727_70570 [Actinomadura napierensis]|uniref:Uncharacterized protein n=1 Tax=Actinomadura napierensis TaxID=267854 RepID=A0ABP5M1F1_9ACTN
MASPLGESASMAHGPSLSPMEPLGHLRDACPRLPEPVPTKTPPSYDKTQRLFVTLVIKPLQDTARGGS